MGTKNMLSNSFSKAQNDCGVIKLFLLIRNYFFDAIGIVQTVSYLSLNKHLQLWDVLEIKDKVYSSW